MDYKCNSGYHKQFIFYTRHALITLEHYKNICIEEKKCSVQQLDAFRRKHRQR